MDRSSNAKAQRVGLLNCKRRLLDAIAVLSMLAAVTLCAAQSFTASPEFEVADVHSIPLAPKALVQTSSTGGRYEIRYATMSDFIRLAYGYEPDKITGGPSWLELDQFDVTAQMDPSTSQEDRKSMLQALLAERFQLSLHKEMKPLPTYVLKPTKKPLLKEAGGSEQSECKIEDAPPAPDGLLRQMAVDGPNGAIITFTLGPGDTIHYRCRNMTMATFAAGLRSMWGAAAQVGPNNVIDETGLSGAWNFDVHWTAGYSPQANSGPRVSLVEAVEKQLGLKLEQKAVSAPVLVVDSVNREPALNPPYTMGALPPILPPKEFEVADVKESDPSSRARRFATPSPGRLAVEGITLESLVYRAFGVHNSEGVVGIPGWAGSARFDINATFQAASSFAMADGLAPMMRALLENRFQMKWHKEERPIAAYSLVAVKPNMKKAEPDSRIFCKTGQPPPGSSNSRTITCQNASMDLFAAKLLDAAPGLNWPIVDATGLEGRWDFGMEFQPNPPIAFVARGGDAGLGAPSRTAVDPNSALTIFEAVQKLGLKLQAGKRQLPVIVIDHLEQKPTEN